jgi:hypothetical protein
MMCCNVSTSPSYVVTLYRMLGRTVDSRIMRTLLGCMSMVDMNASSRRGGNVAVKHTTCVCRLINSRNCNTLRRNFLVDCNTEWHSLMTTRSNCWFNNFALTKSANNCDTADSAIMNTICISYGSAWLSLHIAHQILSFWYRSAMSSCNMIFGITTIVTPSRDAAAGNIAADDGVQCLSLFATELGLGSIHLLQLLFYIDLPHLLLLFELSGILLLFNPSLDIRADILHFV